MRNIRVSFLVISLIASAAHAHGEGVAESGGCNQCLTNRSSGRVVKNGKRIHAEFGPRQTPTIFHGSGSSLSATALKIVNMCTSTPYKLGGAFTMQSGVLNLDNKGIDCSAFVSSVLLGSGCKLAVGYPSQRVTTAALNQISHRADTCLPKVQDGSLHAGDILDVASGHTVLVTSVGPDPLGIERSHGSCDNLSFLKFNFSIAQSTSHGDQGGRLSNGPASSYLGGSIRSALQKFAKAICKGLSPSAFNVGAASRFGILRHRETPGCKTAPMGVKC